MRNISLPDIPLSISNFNISIKFWAVIAGRNRAIQPLAAVDRIHDLPFYFIQFFYKTCISEAEIRARFQSDLNVWGSIFTTSYLPLISVNDHIRFGTNLHVQVQFSSHDNVWEIVQKVQFLKIFELLSHYSNLQKSIKLNSQGFL